MSIRLHMCLRRNPTLVKRVVLVVKHMLTSSMLLYITTNDDFDVLIWFTSSGQEQ